MLTHLKYVSFYNPTHRISGTVSRPAGIHLYNGDPVIGFELAWTALSWLSSVCIFAVGGLKSRLKSSIEWLHGWNIK